MSMYLKIILAASYVSAALALKVDENSLSGTASMPYLTDKQLAIQRWFSQLTFLQDPADWSGWGDSVHDVDCDGNTCIRYEIAGLAYAAAVLAHKTPAYTQVVEQVLYGAISRMTDKLVWQYIELFDDFKNQPTYPDPVAYKNIMYSGHLAQMIALYESITGNFTFSTDGWNFVWGIDSEYPDPIPYNTSLLMEAIHRQTKEYSIGGVPCEPDSIFVICNSYPMNAFALHDTTHGSSFAGDSIPQWHATVVEHGTNKIPDVDKNDNNFFNLDYLIHPLGIWEPIGSVGSDVWALSWMQGWWPADSSDTLLQDAFKSVYESSQWIVESSNISTASLLTEPVSIEQDSLSTYSYLHPGPGSAVFPFSDEITTSFYPMLEKQYLLPTISSKINSVYQYFEYNMGRLFDSDGDSVMDSYQYNTLLRQCGDNATCETGDYSVWASANLLISMTWPNSNPNFLKSLFHPDMPLFQRYVEQPKVLSVEFPHVMVRSATYTTLASVEHDDSFNSSKAPNGSLKFELLPGDNYPRLPHDVVLRGSIDYVLSMKLNGEDYSDFRSGTKNTIIIMAPGWGQCDDDVIFEFTVLFMAAGA